MLLLHLCFLTVLFASASEATATYGALQILYCIELYCWNILTELTEIWEVEGDFGEATEQPLNCQQLMTPQITTNSMTSN